MEKELHDKAWKLLEEKGFKLGEMVMVRSHFANTFKNEYPFIAIKHSKGGIDHYYSEIDNIKNLRFGSESEVILANAIYENMKQDFNINDFIQTLKYTFRLIGVNSMWV